MSWIFPRIDHASGCCNKRSAFVWRNVRFLICRIKGTYVFTCQVMHFNAQAACSPYLMIVKILARSRHYGVSEKGLRKLQLDAVIATSTTFPFRNGKCTKPWKTWKLVYLVLWYSALVTGILVTTIFTWISFLLTTTPKLRNWLNLMYLNGPVETRDRYLLSTGWGLKREMPFITASRQQLLILWKTWNVFLTLMEF